MVIRKGKKRKNIDTEWGDRGARVSRAPSRSRRRWCVQGRRNDVEGFPADVRAATEAPAASTASFQCVDSVVHPKAHSPTHSRIRPRGILPLSSAILSPQALRSPSMPPCRTLATVSLSLSHPPAPVPLSPHSLTAILASSSRSGAPVRAARARELSRPKAERTRSRGKG